MGNKTSTKNTKDKNTCYKELISMGYNPNAAALAFSKYPNDLNLCIDFIHSTSNAQPLETKQDIIDDNWKSFSVGDIIDARDRWAKWYSAHILQHKPASESLPNETIKKLHKHQKRNIDNLQELEAIHIHFTQWEDKWNEWVFIKSDTLCTCSTLCITDRSVHRLAAPNTQTKYKQKCKLGENGCVGIHNLGKTSFISSIIQCLSHTQPFHQYFTSMRYKSDLHSISLTSFSITNSLAQLFDKMAVMKVIWPNDFLNTLTHYDPKYASIFQEHDAMQFLSFLLNKVHDELNLIRNKPYTEPIVSNGRKDEIVADLSWQIHLKQNKSKIVDLFEAQLKCTMTCVECGYNNVSFKTYTHLSLPIADADAISLIVDVMHRDNDHIDGYNKPIRYVFHMERYQKVQDLARIVSNIYNTKETLVTFYQNWNMKITKRYHRESLLAVLPLREAIACYILKDWNKEFDTNDIKNYDIGSCFAAGFHYHSTPFGMPFLVSFPNICNTRELHQIVYLRLHLWLGSNTMQTPPIFDNKIKLLKLIPQNIAYTVNGFIRENIGEYYNFPALILFICLSYYHPFPSNPSLCYKIKKLNEPNFEFDLTEYEAKWDRIFENMPYKLRLVNVSDIPIGRDALAERIPIDDSLFICAKNNKIDIMIDWNKVSFNEIKSIVNKVVVDLEYSKWKKEKIASKNVSDVALSDCFDKYINDSKENDDLLHCFECKKKQKMSIKLDIWSLPEIIIIHLQRFESFGEFGAISFNGKFVKYPIDDVLDLSKYELKSDSKPQYVLYAVLSYIENGDHSKYIVTAKQNQINQWILFAGSKVKVAQRQDILSANAYILFYQKVH